MMNRLFEKRGIGILALVGSACMIIYGAYRGEIRVVLGKAIKICMECIGIG